MAELIVTLKGRELRRVPITMTDTVIGRDPSSDVRIDNPGVSRTHAVVRYRDFIFRVWDHGSANGLFVNGRRVDWLQLGYIGVAIALVVGSWAIALALPVR